MSDFSDVGDFHRKFGLPAVPGTRPRAIDAGLRDFRLRFLLEELTELCEGYGLELRYEISPIAPSTQTMQDLPRIADALVDLAYVTLGAAHVHGLPWGKLFADVQRANMTKERCKIDHVFDDSHGDGYCGHPLDESTACDKDKFAHSLRGSAHDVIKPEGWRAPDTANILLQAGWPGPGLPL